MGLGEIGPGSLVDVLPLRRIKQLLRAMEAAGGLPVSCMRNQRILEAVAPGAAKKIGS